MQHVGQKLSQWNEDLKKGVIVLVGGILKHFNHGELLESCLTALHVFFPVNVATLARCAIIEASKYLG
jgi:hypothetical protein